MIRGELISRLHEVLNQAMPLPAGGQTPLRHRLLMEIGREDLSLARLAEAHWDAVAILAEAGRRAAPGALYGVWASEIPGKALTLVEQAGSDVLRRLTRAYGPHPLALDATVSRRYQELDLYLRQSHAERDLEALGVLVRSNPSVRVNA